MNARTHECMNASPHAPLLKELFVSLVRSLLHVCDSGQVAIHAMSRNLRFMRCSAVCGLCDAARPTMRAMRHGLWFVRFGAAGDACVSARVAVHATQRCTRRMLFGAHFRFMRCSESWQPRNQTGCTYRGGSHAQGETPLVYDWPVAQDLGRRLSWLATYVTQLLPS